MSLCSDILLGERKFVSRSLSIIMKVVLSFINLDVALLAKGKTVGPPLGLFGACRGAGDVSLLLYF